MNKNLLSRLSLSLFLLIFSTPLNSSPLRVIDQTWQVFQDVPEEYKKFSIIHGAILAETNWIFNFYRFANFYPIKTIDRRGREVISYDPAKTDNVTKLIYTLFYQVPGSTSPADFSTTDFMNSSDPKKIALLGAQILVSLDGLATIDISF